MKLRLWFLNMRNKLWEHRIRWRYRKQGLKQPVYDRKRNIYYVENNKGELRAGCIENIAGEYVYDEFDDVKVIYHFNVFGQLNYEYSFSGVLAALLSDCGLTFSIPYEYLREYSEQEQALLKEFQTKLIGDNEPFVCNSRGYVPIFYGRQARKVREQLMNAQPPNLENLHRLADEFEQRMLEARKSTNICEGRFTVADAMQMDEDAELIFGKLYVERGIPVPDSRISSEIKFALIEYICEHKLNEKVFPYSVGLFVNDILEDVADTLLLPDVMTASDSAYDDDGVHKPPKLVVEVTTDQTRAIDYKVKLELYCKMGVEEYWVVDVKRRQITKYLRRDDYVPDVCTDWTAVEVSSYPGLVINLQEALEK